MSTRIFPILGTLLLATALLATAKAGPVDDDAWYFSPMIGVNFEDPDRRASAGYDLRLGFGRRFAENWAIEFGAFGGELDGFQDHAMFGFTADLLRLFSVADDRIAPYFLFGTGYIKTHIAEGNRTIVSDYESDIASAGLGIIAPLGDVANMRLELRYRPDFHDSPTFNDFILSIGLFQQIGSRTPPPPPLDTDGDGVGDDVDVCPGTAPGARVDAYGCELDSDGDGVGDSKDRCPNTPAGTRVDGRGCPPVVDSDRDGVPDDRDRCPGTPRSVKVGPDGCELDDDRDGVVNSVDSCPNTKRGVRVDVRGCEIKEKIDLPGVRFELNSARLLPESRGILDEAAETLRRNPDLRVESAGHTDATGTAEYNLDLSKRRAASVRQYLIDKGVDAGRITSQGYGESSPVADNSDRDGRKRNRRVELRVLN